jgi:small subunit ribosomal protein S20
LPKLRSSKKRLRQNHRARVRNKAVRTLMRTSIRKIQTTEDKAQAEALLPEVVSVIDRTAKKGVIHKNMAARHKSRLVRKVNSM